MYVAKKVHIAFRKFNMNIFLSFSEMNGSLEYYLPCQAQQLIIRQRIGSLASLFLLTGILSLSLQNILRSTGSSEGIDQVVIHKDLGKLLDIVHVFIRIRG